jgi:hypothetical protein
MRELTAAVDKSEKKRNREFKKKNTLRELTMFLNDDI